MPRRARAHAALLALVLLTLLCGCGRKGQDEVGVVAKVNGRPIRLEMLEYQYDLLHFDALSGTLPTVGALREAYGQIVGGLIAMELVSQELEKRGQDVNDEELAQAEAKVRADYPDDTFEQMLTDEFIDLAMWRKHLRYACGVEKFQRLVLRPRIHLDYREVEAYYREHVSEFRLPERVRLLVVHGPGREMVDKSLSLYRQQKNVAAVVAAFPGVQAREVTVPRELLNPGWAEALHSAQPGGAGVVIPGRGAFEGLLLLEALAAQTLDVAQAYPQVEAALVEQRLQQIFEAWLAKAVDASVIRVSRRLLEQGKDEDLPSEPEPAVPDQQGGQDVASGNETG